MSIENLLPHALNAGAQIDRLTCALASSTGHPGKDGLDVLIGDALRRVTQLLGADYAMVESEGSDGERGRRHVWSRPGAIVGREPRVSVSITPKGGPPSEFSIGVRDQGVEVP